MRVLSRFLARLLVGVALAACVGRASAQSFADASQAELIKAAPELNALEFDSDQSKLDPLLRATGQQVKSMFAKFINVSAAEDVHAMRFDNTRLIWTEQRDKFRYVAQTNPFGELRRREPSNASGSFPIAGRFEEMLNDLLPENQSRSRFRYLGRASEGGSRSVVLAFATKDGTRQGLVWVDQANAIITRMRTDVLKHPEAEKFDSFSRDVRFVPVNFAALETAPWLPSAATVDVRFAGGEMHSVHRFSDYHVDGFEKDTDPTQIKEDTGEALGQAVVEDDAIEVLLKGVLALEAGKAPDAVAPLQTAARLLAGRLDPTYYLGLALYATHELAEAEAQFREMVKRSPNLALAHNELGMVLFSRGDRAGAVAEFQEALRLEPENTDVRANLDQAMKQPEVPVSPTAGEVTIKVDVRQVLVPVVVTDKEGHHVTGLTKADFRVFEDGIEQKITAFASERADVPAPPTPSAGASAPDVSAPKPLAKRHAYVICVDTMHASFGNFVYVREALQKLFQQEQAGDSQYVVIAIGHSVEIVQNTTSDPAKVLETLSGTGFRKTFLQSQKGSSALELANYDRELQEVRALCDSPDQLSRMQCEIRKPVLPSEAERIAEYNRITIIQFLAQLRSVVEQLARGSGRRTLVLLSDGFMLTPGKAPFELLAAYFPELHSMRAIERMQDAMEPIYKLAVKGNVPIYTIDSRGLYTSPGLDASRGSVRMSAAPQVDRTLNDMATDEGLTLSEIAAATGGTFFHNSNDIFAGLKKAFADGREYYMLAYVPANEAQDGKFRKIEVRVSDSKAQVSAKRGYWAPSQ